LESAWDDRYEELKNFKTLNHHCNVPQKLGKLGKWVEKQRQKYRQGRLSEQRIQLLEELNFQWTIFGNQNDTTATIVANLANVVNQSGDVENSSISAIESLKYDTNSISNDGSQHQTVIPMAGKISDG